MKILTKYAGPLLVLAATSFCTAQEESPQESNPGTSDSASTDQESSRPAGLDAIRAGAQKFVEAFDKADAAAIANLWTADGEYVDASGGTHAGRQAIQESYEEYFGSNPGAKIRIGIDSFKLFSDAVVIEEGRTLVEVSTAAPALSRYRAVHVKVDGQWKMASVQDELVDAPVAQQNLEDLNFLTGTWKAEEHGNQYVSVCRWVANRSFIQRDFTTHVD